MCERIDINNAIIYKNKNENEKIPSIIDKNEKEKEKMPSIIDKNEKEKSPTIIYKNEKEKISTIIYKNEKEKMTSNEQISESTNEANSTSIIDKKQKNKKCLLIIIVHIIIILIITIIILPVIFYVNKNKKKDKDKEDIPLESNKNFTNIGREKSESINNYLQDHGLLESKFTINTKVNDLKRIFVHRKSYENIISNGELTKILVDIKTYYDIYIISEFESDEQNKNYYNKTYSAAIAISSQCLSTENENCEPKNLVNFIDPDYSELDNLEEIDDLKDIPITLCLFNITNNNVITSMICPEALSENTIHNIILDLYFFRPPSIKSLDDNKDEFEIIEDKKNKKKYFREKNKGICDIYNPINSYCSTEMNTITDLDNNLLSNDKNDYTQIVTNENNYYIKNEIINLVDISNNIKLLNPVKFNETLSKFLEKLNPYMKYKEYFSNDNFKELYSVSKKLPTIQKRNLNEEKQTIINEKSFFNFTHYGGVQISLLLKNNMGYNSDAMEAIMSAKIDNYEENIVNIKNYTNIDQTLKNLIYLSKAGNKLSTDLRNVIEQNFFEVEQLIEMNISSLHEKIEYKNISELFDPRLYLNYTTILPLKLLNSSNELVNYFSQLLNDIENGSLKKNINILNTNIYKYIQESHILVNNIFNNIKDLGDTLNSKKNKLTEISTYYSEHSQTSYINIIKDAENILMNYFKKENDTINEKIGNLFQIFEENLKKTLEKEMNSVNDIYNNLNNKTMRIEEATDEDSDKIINNLYDINDNVYTIIKEIKNQIGKEIDIKDSNYTISLKDIQSNNNTFSQTLEKAKEIATKLDNDSFIDKTFDEVMTKFREQFTYIIKYMDEKKHEYSPLFENNLKDNFFTLSEQNNITNEFILLSDGIVDFVKEENNEFLVSVNNKINNFLLENKDYLNQLIYNISNILSEKLLKEISDLYDIGFNNCLSRIENETNQNEILTNNYFCNLTEILDNNSKINELITLENPSNKELNHSNNYQGFNLVNTDYTDLIKTKKITQGYLIKYQKFKTNYIDYKDYFDSKLSIDLMEKYKNVIIKTKEILQSIKDNKITNEYFNYKQFDFIDNNIKDIDELYIRLNNYLSNEIFNEKYIQKIENFKSNQKDKIQKIILNIEKEHNRIKTKKLEKEYDKDFCFTFEKKIAYTSTSVLNYKGESGSYCLNIPHNSNNCNQLIAPSIDNDNKLKEFSNKFINLNSTLSQKAKLYNEKINELRNIISSTEKEIINKKKDFQNLTLIQNKINNILSKKYGDELIKGSYEYYQTLNENFDILFYNISDLWNNAFEELENNINKKINDFKHSTKSLGIMALLYENIITSNITRNYFNSIHNHLKDDFNYTIIYYYNFLFKEINSIYKYILNSIPKNNDGFNNIINQRINEINIAFNKLIEDIEKSKIKALSIDNQIDVLKVTSDNFFNLNSKLVNHIKETSDILKNKALYIYLIDNKVPIDEYSLTCKFYLENNESKKQIDEFYDPIAQKVFIDLNLENLKELLFQSLKFDKKKFENDINLAINDSNKRILSLYLFEKKNYENILENAITNIFTKETFYAHIDSLFNNEIKNLDDNKTEEIKQNVEEIVNIVQNHLSNEAKKINSTNNSYISDFSLINKTLNNYKENIFIKIKENIFKIIEDRYININENIYNRFIKTNLDEYLNFSIEFNNTNTKEYKLINYSFNTGNIIYEIVKNLVEKYENITKSSIKYLYDEYITKVSNDVNLDSIKNFIYNEIEIQYNSTLLNALQNYAINQPGDTGHYEYDLSDEIKEDIESTINLKVKNIYNIMLSAKGIDNFRGSLSLENVDFSLMELSFLNISNFFDYFIIPQKEKQQKEINKIIQNIIDINFNESINNIITYFGYNFFERIIKYNENYKITSLDQHLKYSLIITLQYYNTLYRLKEVKALTKDLKLKLFNLNNLDLKAQEENNKVLILLNQKIDTFIQETKYEFVNKCMSYMEINDTFDKEINQKINDIIKISKIHLQNNYESILNQLFKEKFISSYTKIMNSETKEIIDFVNTQKEYIKLEIEDLFSIDTENILNTINNKRDKTLNSIEDFNNHLNHLIISNDLSNYLNSYGKKYIQPLYERFTTFIFESTKDKIVSNLNLKVQDYEKIINEDEILNYLDTINTDINNFFNNINNSIILYGIEEYPNNLDNEINKIEQQSRRRLNKEETAEDILNEFKIPDKSVDENFRKILNSPKNIKKIFDLKKLEKFDEKINSSIKNLSISCDASEKSINDNINIDSEILLGKLQYLHNKSLTYYDRIKERFNLLKNYINESIYEFDELLKNCTNITYQEFTKKYEEISNKVQSIESEESYSISEVEIKDLPTKINDKEYITDAKFKGIEKQAKFEFKLEFEKKNNFKKPKVVAWIINRSKPKNIFFQIYSKFGNCGRNIQEISFDLNNLNKLNYTSKIDFNTNSTNIYVSIFEYFEFFEYETKIYQIIEESKTECVKKFNIPVCPINSNCVVNDKNNATKFKNIKSNKNQTMIISF